MQWPIGSIIASPRGRLKPSALAPPPPFFVILLSPAPLLPSQPTFLTRGGLFGRRQYRYITAVLEPPQGRSPPGIFYLLLSSDSDLVLLGALIKGAGFRSRQVAEQSLLVESFIIYELRVG